MPARRSSFTARSRHALATILLGAFATLQLALPLAHASQHPVATMASTSTRAMAIETLKRAVGHAVTTCHHGEDGQSPAGDAEPCCPCVLCHILTVSLPAFEIVAFVRPATCETINTYPQPPPRHASTALPRFAGPRGPPLLG